MCIRDLWVTAGQYTAFLNAVAATDTHGLYIENMGFPDESYGIGIHRSGLSGSYIYDVDTNWTIRPVVNYVSWFDAARFTNWLTSGNTELGVYRFTDGMFQGIDRAAAQATYGKAYWIPTEDEWYKAAYYDPATGTYFAYPTSSNTLDDNMANHEQFVGHVTNVGTYPYASPYGTFDQGGNVFEWNETLVTSSWRGLRGGSWAHDSVHLQADSRVLIDIPDGGFTVGFRVASNEVIPEPASIAVWLGLCVTGMLWSYRKRKS